MRLWLCGVACAATACVSSHLGPGILREDWNQPRRDPDPTRNPTEEPTGNPWAEHDDRVAGPGEARPEPDPAVPPAVARAAAVAAAWLAGGWTPLLTWSGTFEETPGVEAPPPR